MKKSDKGKKILTTVLIISLVLIVVGTAYAVTIEKVIAWGTGAWSGTSRIIPSLAKIAGGQAAGNFYRVAFGWPGVAVMATCLAGQYIYDHRNDEGALGDAIRAFLGHIGYRATVTGVQKGTLAGEGSLTPNQAASDEMAARVAQLGISPVTVFWFSSYSAAAAAFGSADYWCSYGGKMSVITGDWAGTNAGHATVTRHNGTHPPGVHTAGKIPDGYRYYVFAYPRGAGAVTAETNWVDRTPAQLQTDAEAKLTDGTQDATEKTLWEELEKKISEALRTNDTATLTKTNAAGKTLQDAINEQTEAAVNSESTPAEDSVGVIEAIMNLTNTLVEKMGIIGNYILGLPQTITNALGGNIEGTNPPSPPEENPDISQLITDFGLEDKKDTEKNLMKTLLDNISSSFDEFRQTITGALQNMVEVSGSCGVFSTTVFGNDFALNFCEFDFSALKSGILFVAGLYAFLILLGVV